MDNEISLQLVCKQCAEEADRSGTVPISNLLVGLTKKGKIQVWCTSHQTEVISLFLERDEYLMAILNNEEVADAEITGGSADRTDGSGEEDP